MARETYLQTLQKEITPDVSFEIYGAVRIDIKKLDIDNPNLSFTIYGVENCNILSYGGSFSVDNVQYTSYTPSSNSAVITVENKDYALYVKETKYRTNKAFSFTISANSVVAFDLSNFKYTKISSLIASTSVNSLIHGKFEVIDFTALTNLNIKAKDAIFDLGDFVDNTSITNFQIPGTNSTGSIASLAKMKSCGNMSFADTGVGGVVEDMADGLVLNGKSSGQIVLNGTNSNIKKRNGNTIGYVVIKFGSSMVNPTTEDTERGYQL